MDDVTCPLCKDELETNSSLVHKLLCDTISVVYVLANFNVTSMVTMLNFILSDNGWGMDDILLLYLTKL